MYCYRYGSWYGSGSWTYPHCALRAHNRGWIIPSTSTAKWYKPTNYGGMLICFLYEITLWRFAWFFKHCISLAWYQTHVHIWIFGNWVIIQYFLLMSLRKEKTTSYTVLRFRQLKPQQSKMQGTIEQWSCILCHA